VSGGPRVAVVIPAHDAQATLDETLHSVRSQTHRALEIVVVDDGSTDATRAIAHRHAGEDGRIHVLHQAQGGVAAARNAGWRHAQSDFVAFIDADDLWAPATIEQQLAVLLAAGPRTALAYAWHARIDSASRIVEIHDGPRHRGNVLHAIVRDNFVGNGSAALVRREALHATGGFEPRLRAQDAQGCEDVLFYCRVAEAFEFEVVPRHLVGYRIVDGAMSADRVRMLRSWALMADEMKGRHRQMAGIIDEGVRDYAGWLLADALAHCEPGQSLSLLRRMLSIGPRRSLRTAWREGLHRWRARRAGSARRDPRLGQPFAARIDSRNQAIVRSTPSS
jgi:hypothetical protein